MPTLFRIGSYRVMVYTNDHSPAHVHAVGVGGHAKFELGRTPDDVALVESFGISTAGLERIAAEIIARHRECRSVWRKYHGN